MALEVSYELWKLEHHSLFHLRQIIDQKKYILGWIILLFSFNLDLESFESKMASIISSS